MVFQCLSKIHSSCIITEKEAVWLLGDQHLQHLIPKFRHNRHRYLELSVFEQFEYHFEADLKMEDVQNHLLGMFQIHDHILQAIVIIAGTNNIGICSKAQMRARSKDMVTDTVALWAKALLDSTMKLGLFVSLVPPCLWYKGFLQQKAGREVRRSLNSHIGKICKLLQATVIPHPHLQAEEKWFHDPQSDAIMLSEPGYDLMLQDICLAIATKLQFSPIPQQREVALLYWHQAPPSPVPEQRVTTKSKGKKKGWRKHYPH